MADHDDKSPKTEGRWVGDRNADPLSSPAANYPDGYRAHDPYAHFGGFGVFATDDILERLARGEERRFWNRTRETAGKHRGHGPKTYVRSDARIFDDVNDRLTDDSWLDARDIEATVKDAEVTLDGHVRSRDDKRRAEMLAERVSGVVHVQNNLRVKQRPHAADGASEASPLPLI